MDSKAMNCFLTLVETQNMRKAAESLFITQQGMSRIIIKLEKEMGCRLFERKREGMFLTREGERLYETVRRVRTEFVELHRDLAHMQLMRPVIRLACAFGTLHRLYPLIRRFRDLYPDIELIWTECLDHVCEKRLDDDKADLAFNVFSRNKSKYITEHLFSSNMVVLALEGDPLLDKEILDIADLDGRRIIMAGEGYHIFEVVKQKCMDHGFYPEAEGGVKETTLVHELVAMGEGIGLTVDCLTGIIHVPGVQFRPLNPQEITWDAEIVRSADKKMTKETELFWNYMISEIRKSGQEI